MADFWHRLPDPLLLYVFSFLPANDLVHAAQTCKQWHDVASDDFLWRDLVLKKWNINSQYATYIPKAGTWKSEYKRLFYHVPCIESEVLQGEDAHLDEVLYVSYSHNGSMIATSSKDGSVKIWDTAYPVTLIHTRYVNPYHMKFPQFTKFNADDSKLFICGPQYDDYSGIFLVLDISDKGMQDLVQLDFLQTLIEDELEPFDVYGDFFHCNGVDYIVSGHNDEIETYIFLKKVSNSKEITPDYVIFNQMQAVGFGPRYVTLATIMLSNCTTEPHQEASAVEQSESIDARARAPQLPNTESSPDDTVFQSPPEDGSEELVNPGAQNFNDHKFAIFTSGVQGFVPHRIAIVGLNMAEKVQEYEQADQSAVGAAREPDHLFELHGQIIGMALSPDHRLLYVNKRSWPPDFRIDEDFHITPPISNNIDMHVIDLVKMENLGVKYTGHKGFTPASDCFYVFMDVCELYVASGSEDKQGRVWDRDYGCLVATLPHEDVVNCTAFKPNDHEVLVTTGDDYKVKIWRSRNRQRELNMNVNEPCTSKSQCEEEDQELTNSSQ